MMLVKMMLAVQLATRQTTGTNDDSDDDAPLFLNMAPCTVVRHTRLTADD